MNAPPKRSAPGQSVQDCSGGKLISQGNGTGNEFKPVQDHWQYFDSLPIIAYQQFKWLRKQDVGQPGIMQPVPLRVADIGGQNWIAIPTSRDVFLWRPPELKA